MEDQDPGSDEGTDFLLADEAAAKGGHPAWQEILDAIPEQYREAVMPTLEKWDKGVNKRFQSLHSKYEPLKALEGYDPEQVQMGLNLLERINEDPRAVYDLMAQSFGFTSEQGVSENEESMSEQQFETDPALMSKLTAQEQRLAQLEQEREMQQFQEQLDGYLAYLHEPEPGKRVEFDDDYVITLLANGVDGEEAVSRYQKIVEAATPVNNTPPPAPRIMPSGGGVPSNAIDPKTLTDGQTKDLVAQMLQQALES